jgi:16S rRNA (guanine1207-N2)-methyltransferase
MNGEHYFTERPRARSHRTELRFLYRGEMLSFQVDTGVFAGHGLDRGTELLIANMLVGPRDRVLDLGCGWGPVGVAAAKSASEGHVILTDVNRRATSLARRNLERNAITNAEVRAGSLFAPVPEERFDVIATNPPYHAGRPLIVQLLSEAPAHLEAGGRLLLVGKGSQGIRFYQAWLEAHWPGSVEVVDRGSGYRVLEAGVADAASAVPGSPSPAPSRSPGTKEPGTAARTRRRARPT